jgi:tellurite methyltransferase
MIELSPSALLAEFLHLLEGEKLPGPVLDLACAECRNGIFVAKRGLEVVCCDRAAERLAEAREIAMECGVSISTWEADLEISGGNPLPEEAFGAILVFRFLHRPLIPFIKKALCHGGLLFYETFTAAQPRFGRPHSPQFLLQEGELLQWFENWEIIHYFEGIKENPARAVAQIVCRKPGASQSDHEGHEEHQNTSKDRRVGGAKRNPP